MSDHRTENEPKESTLHNFLENNMAGLLIYLPLYSIIWHLYWHVLIIYVKCTFLGFKEYIYFVFNMAKLQQYLNIQ